MLDQIMELVKSQVAKTVGGIDGIPAGKESAVVETTAASLVGGLKKNATLDGLGALLGGGGGAGKAMASSLSTGVVQALTSKLGLNPAVARTIASTVIPAVMSLLSKRVADKGEPGFNLESILGGLTGGVGGGAGGGGGLGGLLGGLGSLLGKK
jgi:hypothetical protein